LEWTVGLALLESETSREPALGTSYVAFNLSLYQIFLPRYRTYIVALSSSMPYTLLLVRCLRLFAREMAGARELLPQRRKLRPPDGEVLRGSTMAT
jgi:hypothetical protein